MYYSTTITPPSLTSILSSTSTNPTAALSISSVVSASLPTVSTSLYASKSFFLPSLLSIYSSGYSCCIRLVESYLLWRAILLLSSLYLCFKELTSSLLHLITLLMIRLLMNVASLLFLLGLSRLVFFFYLFYWFVCILACLFCFTDGFVWFGSRN